MPLYVESLRAEDGRFEPLWPHEERMTRTRKDLFGISEPFDLAGALERRSGDFESGLWKVRVLYDGEIRAVESAPYVPRSYASAALVDGGEVEYGYKAVERPDLDALGEAARRLGAATALVVSRGFITDFLHANAAFSDGRGWFTPAEPLLRGTRRARLLAEGLIEEMRIRPADLGSFSAVCPINAMLDLEEVVMDMECIVNRRGFGSAG